MKKNAKTIKLPKGMTLFRLKCLMALTADRYVGYAPSRVERWLVEHGYVQYGPWPKHYPGGSSSHSWRLTDKGRALVNDIRAPYWLVGKLGGTASFYKLNAAQEAAQVLGVLETWKGELMRTQDGRLYFFPEHRNEPIDNAF